MLCRSSINLISRNGGVKAFSTFLIVLGTLAVVASNSTYQSSDEQRLMKFLFKNYDPTTRPVINSSKAVEVKTQFTLELLDKLDAKRQVLATKGYLSLSWRDEHLTWEPKQFGNLAAIVVPPNKIWLPDIALHNSDRDLYNDLHFNSIRAILYSTGVLWWEPGGLFHSACQVDVTYYPLDMQSCELIFGNWAYFVYQVDMVNASNTINVNNVHRNGEWDIVETSVQKVNGSFACCPGEIYAELRFRITLKRKVLFYIINIILPSTMIAILVPMIFLLPPDGSKMNMGLKVLLNFCILMLMVSEMVPSTSDSVPVLGVYLCWLVVITSVSVLISAISLHYSNTPHLLPPPKWASNLIFNYIGKALRMQPLKLRSAWVTRREKYKAAHPENAMNLLDSGYSNGACSPTYANTSQVEGGFQQLNQNGLRANSKHSYIADSASSPEEGFLGVRSEINELLKHMRTMVEVLEEKEGEEDIRRQWQGLTCVIDKLCFLVCLVSIVCFPIILFFVVPGKMH